MTTIDAAAAWHVGKRKSLAAIAAILALGFAGCESGTSLFSSAGDPAAQTAITDPAAQPGQGSKIAVASVFGPPDGVAKQLQSQMAASIEKQRISVAKQPTDKAEYTLRGYIVAAKEKAGTKVSYIWDVTDPAGKRVNRITGEEVTGPAQDPWAAVTPQVIDNIVAKTTSPLVAWLPTQGSQAAVAQQAPPSAPASSLAPAAPAPQQPTPVAAATPPAGAAAPAVPGQTTGSIGRPGAMNLTVSSVTGAPGDGGVSLTSAIQRELAKKGAAMGTGPAGYKVEGKVSVAEAKDGKQPITITWNVKDAKGASLGTVSQKNEIAPGSLDGAWGKTADAVAAGAAPKILDLINGQTAQAGQSVTR